jgi:hypothetical protein
MMQGINTLYKSRYENEVMTLFEELLCMNLKLESFIGMVIYYP